MPRQGDSNEYPQHVLWRNELPHDKTNKVAVRPAKTQISLGICPVWSESSLCTHWVAKDPSFIHADSEDSDQTRRIPRLIWVFARHTVILLVLTRGSSNMEKFPLIIIRYPPYLFLWPSATWNEGKDLYKLLIQLYLSGLLPLEMRERIFISCWYSCTYLAFCHLKWGKGSL